MSGAWWSVWCVGAGMLACSTRDEVYWWGPANAHAVAGLTVLVASISVAILWQLRSDRRRVLHAAAAMVVGITCAILVVAVGGRIQSMEWTMPVWSRCVGFRLAACMEVGSRADGALLLNCGGGLLVWRGTLEKFAFLPLAASLASLLAMRWCRAVGALTWLRGCGGMAVAALCHACITTLLFCAHDDVHAASVQERTLVFLSGVGGTATALVAITFWLPALRVEAKS